MGAERKLLVNGEDNGGENIRTLKSGDRYAHVAQPLWSEKDSATTAGTSVESNVYLYTLPANTLSTNESVLTISLNGFFAANARSKYVRLFFEGIQLDPNDEYTNNNQPWRIVSEIMRASSSIIECTTIIFLHNTAPLMRYREISSSDIASFNLATTEYDISVELETPDGAGDITVHNGRIVFYPTPG